MKLNVLRICTSKNDLLSSIVFFCFVFSKGKKFSYNATQILIHTFGILYILCVNNMILTTCVAEGRAGVVCFFYFIFLFLLSLSPFL